MCNYVIVMYAKVKDQFRDGMKKAQQTGERSDPMPCLVPIRPPVNPEERPEVANPPHRRERVEGQHAELPQRPEAGGAEVDDVGVPGEELRAPAVPDHRDLGRSEAHTSELPSLTRISNAVFCLKKKI